MKKKLFTPFILLAFMLLFSSCGSQEHNAAGTGGITASAIWLDGQNSQQAPSSDIGAQAGAFMRTAPVGVTTVRMIVSERNNQVAPIQQDFSASLGSGTISSVPADPKYSYKVQLQGLNSSNSVIYQGSAYNITVAAGQTKNAGTITMSAVMAGALKRPWDVATDGTYVYWSERSNGTSGSGSIKRMPVGGGTVTTLASGLYEPCFIVINSTYLYWCEYANGNANAGSIKRVSLSGGTATTLLSNLTAPYNITIDATNIYWTEYLSSGYIKKMPIGGGTVTTLASGSSSFWPFGLAVDSTNVYWSEDKSNGRIQMVPIAGGGVTTLASALNDPTGIAIDSTYVYFTEYGTEDASGNTPASTGAVKKVPIAGGSVSTLATGISWGIGIALDSSNVYFSEFGYSAGSVKSVSINATSGSPITSIASPVNGPANIALDSSYVYWVEIDDGGLKRASKTGTSSSISAPTGLSATAGNGQVSLSWGAVSGATSYNIYYSTSSGVNKLTGTQVSTTSTAYTISGLVNGTTYYFVVTAANGSNESAESTQASAMPSAGTTIQMGGARQGVSLSLSRVVTTLTGSAGLSGSTDGTGTAARFNMPFSITTDGTNLYVTDSNNHTIRKIVISTGAVTTLAGSAALSGSTDGTGTAARFSYPEGITTDGTNLYVADTSNHTIRKIVISTGAVTTLAGSATLSGSTDGTGTAARFNSPSSITTDGTNLYVADTSNHTIRKIVISTGAVTTLAGSAALSGSTDGTGTAARFYYPDGITTDGTNLYVADTYNYTIRKIVISTGVVTTLAGSAALSGSTDGTGTAARFSYPDGITTDGTNLYVADDYYATIRKIVISTGAVTTIAGSPGSYGYVDGTGSAATFYDPAGITTNGSSLFVADYYENTIRKIQ